MIKSAWCSIKVSILWLFASKMTKDLCLFIRDNYDSIDHEGHTQHYKYGSCYVSELGFRDDRWGYASIDYDSDDGYMTFKCDYNESPILVSGLNFSLIQIFYNQFMDKKELEDGKIEEE